MSKAPVGVAGSITTTCASVSPLGFLRLGCVKMVNLLLQINYHLVDTALLQYRIISRVIDLFFQNKWNNILHKAVEGIALKVSISSP